MLSRNELRKALVLYLLLRLSELGTVITERKLQKLVFLVCYRGVDGFFESEGIRSLFDDYRIGWGGVFSEGLRNLLDELRNDELVTVERDETVTEIVLTARGMKVATELARKLDEYIRRKVEWVVEKYGYLTEDELEEETNGWLGISGSEAGSIKALLLGTRVEDLVLTASNLCFRS